MPGAWAAKHPNASSAARVAPNNKISATITRQAATKPAATANTRAPAPRAAAVVSNSTARRPLAAPRPNTRAPTQRVAAAQVNNSTVGRQLAAPTPNTRALTQRAAAAQVNNSTVRRPLAASRSTKPANIASANNDTRAPAQPVAVNTSAPAKPAKPANANNPSLAQRAAAPVPSTHKPLPGVWKTPEKRSPLSKKLLKKVDATRKTLVQRGGEPIAPKDEEGPKYVNTTIKQSSPISRYLAPKIEATRLSLVDRAALPYSAPQPKQVPSAEYTLPVWKPKPKTVIKTVQESGKVTNSNGNGELDCPPPPCMRIYVRATSLNAAVLTNVRASGPIRDVDVNERGETNDDGKDERGRRTGNTSDINRSREQSTESYTSDDGIAFIDHPSPDPFVHNYDLGEGLCGTRFAQDSNGSVDFDYYYNTDSGEGLVGTLFAQEEHSSCGGRGITTLRTESAQSYITVPEFQEIAGVGSLNEENSSEDLEESASSAKTLVGADQPEEENTSEGPEELASIEQQRNSHAESTSGSISAELNELVGFDHPEEDNTSVGPKEVASVKEQRTGRADSYISTVEFQEAVGGFNLSSEENNSGGVGELATHKQQQPVVGNQFSGPEFQDVVDGFNLSNEENNLEGVEELATHEEQQVVVGRQSADATHQTTVGQLEGVYCEQIIQLEQATKEVEQSELRLRAALDKKAEVKRQVAETIKELDKELLEQSLKEKETRQLVETSYARLCRAISERGAIDIEEKVKKSYTRLLAAITAQSVEYKKIVQSFETVEEPADITNKSKGGRRASVYVPLLKKLRRWTNNAPSIVLTNNSRNSRSPSSTTFLRLCLLHLLHQVARGTVGIALDLLVPEVSAVCLAITAFLLLCLLRSNCIGY